MAARRCPKCKTDWPVGFLKPSYMMGGPRFRCPVCNELTTLLSSAKPISQNAADFEIFFLGWDARRIESEVAAAMADLEEAA